MTVKRCGMFGAGLLCMIMALGCQAPSSPAAASSQMSMGKTILASSGNGGYVIFIPASDGTVTTMESPGASVCKQCQDDAINYYKTGKIDPVCSMCGGHRWVLEPSQTIGSTGHQ